jgi:Gram-negative bacterial TonB protein C-terminal
MLFRFGWVFALTCLLLMAKQQELAPNCCEPEGERLSSHQLKALLQKSEPIYLPGTVDKLHIKGTVVMAVAVDDQGEISCVQIISGHPLIIGTTIDSVRRWKFRPYVVRGLRRGFCGRIAISYQASVHGVRYRVIEAP